MVGIEPPGEDRLPLGPERDLVLALHELYSGAGRPGLRRIAEAIRDASAFPDTISHETAGAILRGEGVPRWSKLECLVRQLSDWHHKKPDPDEQVARFHRLWASAGGLATSVPGSAGGASLNENYPPGQPSFVQPSSPLPVQADDSGAELGQAAEIDDLRIYPSKVRMVLKLIKSIFYFDINDHVARNNVRICIDEEKGVIESKLRAVLVMRFGPKNISLSYNRIGFPLGGAIRVEYAEDMRSSGSAWCEVAIEVDAGDLTLLEELRNSPALGHAKSESVSFLYEETFVDVDEFAEDLYDRGVQITSFGDRELAFGKISDASADVAIITFEKKVEIKFVDYRSKQLDVSKILTPVFNYLKIGDHMKPLKSTDDSRLDSAGIAILRSAPGSQGLVRINQQLHWPFRPGCATMVSCLGRGTRDVVPDHLNAHLRCAGRRPGGCAHDEGRASRTDPALRVHRQQPLSTSTGAIVRTSATRH